MVFWHIKSNPKKQKIINLEERLRVSQQAIAQISKETTITDRSSSAVETSDSQISPITKYRRSTSEKTLANILYGIYTNLAFSPQSVKIISDKFSKSHALWKVLYNLENEDTVQKKTIKGIAAKSGWKEVDRHINSGADDRGRIYVRSSKFSHRYDVVIHWKRDERDQIRLFKSLAGYSYFSSCKDIFL